MFRLRKVQVRLKGDGVMDFIQPTVLTTKYFDGIHIPTQIGIGGVSSRFKHTYSLATSSDWMCHWMIQQVACTLTGGQQHPLEWEECHLVLFLAQNEEWLKQLQTSEHVPPINCELEDVVMEKGLTLGLDQDILFFPVRSEIPSPTVGCVTRLWTKQELKGFRLSIMLGEGWTVEDVQDRLAPWLQMSGRTRQVS